MKNKGLIIALIIIITIIIFGLVMFLVSYLNGGLDFKMGIFNFGTRSNNVILDKTFEIQDVKDIIINQNAGDIIFKETANNNIQVVAYGENQNDVSVNLNENKLNINYAEKHTFFLFGTVKSDVIIYLPSRYSDKITVKNDYGECKITDLENASIDIDCDAGNVQLGKIKNATIKCDCGNVEIKEILNKCDIKANCGNIVIEKMSLQEDSNIKADMGNIDINETNDIYIETNVDLGQSNVNKNNRNAKTILKIKCDMRKCKC